MYCIRFPPYCGKQLVLVGDLSKKDPLLLPYYTWQAVCMAGGVHGRGGVRGRGACVAGETAIAAGGTHPTGMLSCFNALFLWRLWMFSFKDFGLFLWSSQHSGLFAQYLRARTCPQFHYQVWPLGHHYLPSCSGNLQKTKLHRGSTGYCRKLPTSYLPLSFTEINLYLSLLHCWSLQWIPFTLPSGTPVPSPSLKPWTHQHIVLKFNSNKAFLLCNHFHWSQMIFTARKRSLRR